MENIKIQDLISTLEINFIAFDDVMPGKYKAYSLDNNMAIKVLYDINSGIIEAIYLQGQNIMVTSNNMNHLREILSYEVTKPTIHKAIYFEDMKLKVPFLSFESDNKIYYYSFDSDILINIVLDIETKNIVSITINGETMSYEDALNILMQYFKLNSSVRVLKKQD